MPKAKLKNFKITATIPTVQYGNIQPEYEIEASTFEEAEKTAMPYIERLWAQYCAKGSELQKKKVAAVSTTQLVKMTSELTPGVVPFDPVNHIYYNAGDKQYLSGSAFCKKFQKPFDKENILKAMETKYDIPQADIAKMWALKGKVSTDFGSALHGALEMYGKFRAIGAVTGANKKPAVNSALHDHPIIRAVVEEFYANRDKEVAIYEAFVSDEDRLLCGQLDRVLIVNREKKICRVQDFKTNADVNRKGYNGKLLAPFDNMSDTPLNGYWLQLSFYGNILEKHGWTVEALDVFAYNGKWQTYTHEMIDLKGTLDD